MALSIGIPPKVENFNTESIRNEIQYPHNEPFEFEVCRKKLWGHKFRNDTSEPTITTEYEYDNRGDLVKETECAAGRVISITRDIITYYH